MRLLPRNSRFFVAGHRGLVGSAIWRLLRGMGTYTLIGRGSDELDLREGAAVSEFIGEQRPDVIVLAAARAGGIAANTTAPADFMSDNLRIQLNIMDAARARRVPRLLFLGSSCIYPKFAPQPITESSLLTGPLEPANGSYAIAKIAGILHTQAVRRQDGLRWISAMPSSLYGPGDNFDPQASHVLPGLLRRFHDARVIGAEHVVLWGSGTCRREFLHADDLARACLVLLEQYDGPDPINVGVGSDVTIRELAEMVADVVDYRGAIVADPSRPDGTPRKLLDVSRIRALGWTPTIGLRQGIESTYRWFLDHRERLRTTGRIRAAEEVTA